MVDKVVIIDALTYCVSVSFDAWSNESTWTRGTHDINYCSKDNKLIYVYMYTVQFIQ